MEKLGAKAEDSGQIERVEWSLRMIITLYFVNCNYVRAAAGISSGRNSREESQGVVVGGVAGSSSRRSSRA